MFKLLVLGKQILDAVWKFKCRTVEYICNTKEFLLSLLSPLDSRIACACFDSSHPSRYSCFLQYLEQTYIACTRNMCTSTQFT